MNNNSLLQIQAGDPANAKYKGPMDCAKQLYKEEGLFRGIYRGTGATLLRGIFIYLNKFHSGTFIYKWQR